MSKDDGGNAFPYTFTGLPGMTLRDYFAAKAMQGLLASPRGTVDDSPMTDKLVAGNAYIVADAMLEARKA